MESRAQGEGERAEASCESARPEPRRPREDGKPGGQGERHVEAVLLGWRRFTGRCSEHSSLRGLSLETASRSRAWRGKGEGLLARLPPGYCPGSGCPRPCGASASPGRLLGRQPRGTGGWGEVERCLWEEAGARGNGETGPFAPSTCRYLPPWTFVKTEFTLSTEDTARRYSGL